MNTLHNIEQIQQALKSFSASQSKVQVSGKYVIINSTKFNSDVFPVHLEVQKFITNINNAFECSKETFKNLKNIFPDISLGQPFIKITQ